MDFVWFLLIGLAAGWLASQLMSCVPFFRARHERANLIDDPARQAEIEAARTELLGELRRIADPLADAFDHRDQETARPLVECSQAPAAGRATCRLEGDFERFGLEHGRGRSNDGEAR